MLQGYMFDVFLLDSSVKTRGRFNDEHSLYKYSIVSSVVSDTCSATSKIGILPHECFINGIHSMLRLVIITIKLSYYLTMFYIVKCFQFFTIKPYKTYLYWKFR